MYNLWNSRAMQEIPKAEKRAVFLLYCPEGRIIFTVPISKKTNRYPYPKLQLILAAEKKNPTILGKNKGPGYVTGAC
jgi:hypothetical protein